MDNKINNEVIIIGGNHHNMLGVLRSLGINGIKSNIIVTNKEKNAYVTKSKYVKKSVIIDEDEEQLLFELNKYVDKNTKSIVIPTSDFAAYILDKNYESLSKKFILPSIDQKEGAIVKYMDKFTQYKLAEKYGIKMAKSIEVSLLSKINYNEITFGKVIIKPIVSANGNKVDIRICENTKDIKNSINELRSLGYKKVLVQEYIDFDQEWGIIGCINNSNIIIPGVMKKIRIYPINRGTTSFAKIEKLPDIKIIEKIKKMLCDINYSGLFDIEIFKKNNDIYMNEINFRNSGSSFVYVYDNINLVFLWMKMKLGMDISKEKIEVTNEYNVIDEFLEYKHLKSKNISLKEFLDARKKSKARLFHYKKDWKVTLYRLFYAVKRRFEK